MSGDFEVDDLGALMAILAGNAGQVEERRGSLGPLNALGDRLLAAAHAARANTRAGEFREFEFLVFSHSFSLFSFLRIPVQKDKETTKKEKKDADGTLIIILFPPPLLLKISNFSKSLTF